MIEPVWLSLKCSFLSAILSLPWGIFWGWVLARKQFKGKLFVQTILYIPLVLPPVLTGYFLLIIFSKNSFLGKFLVDLFHVRFVLDWKGVVLAACVVSAPFMIQMVKSAVEQVDVRFEMAARSLGANFWKVFWTITFPLSWPGIVGGFFLVFARSIGEFGATIILAGNIPGKTQTIPIAIYSKVHLGQDAAMIPLIFCSVLFAYAGLALSHWIGQVKR